MKKIDGTPKTIRELFTGVKYTIHYYQREYQWQTKQIEELIDDLTEEFYEFYSPEDEKPMRPNRFAFETHLQRKQI